MTLITHYESPDWLQQILYLFSKDDDASNTTHYWQLSITHANQFPDSKSSIHKKTKQSLGQESQFVNCKEAIDRNS